MVSMGFQRQNESLSSFHLPRVNERCLDGVFACELLSVPLLEPAWVFLNTCQRLHPFQLNKHCGYCQFCAHSQTPEIKNSSNYSQESQDWTAMSAPKGAYSRLTQKISQGLQSLCIHSTLETLQSLIGTFDSVGRLFFGLQIGCR